jgi:type II restriction enzyme
LKFLPIYKELGLKTENDVFNYLVNSLGDSVKAWDYFVNWDKAFRNTKELEVLLNTWNYLLGKENFDEEFRYLLGKYPESVKLIPSLIVRDGAKSKSFRILNDVAQEKSIEFYDFGHPANTAHDVNRALEFIKQSGLIRIFQKDGVKNLVDYLLGVEAGVDSNGRKNRSGQAMESIVEDELAKLKERHKNWKFLIRASQSEISREWGITNSTGVATRIFDFAVLAENQLVPIEVNIFGGGGTKTKSVAGEFTNLSRTLKSKGLSLIWITDGIGWLPAKASLRDAFDSIDYLLNLELVAKGALEQAVKQAVLS